MNRKHFIRRVHRKICKLLHINIGGINPEKQRKKEALRIGRKINLKNNGYIFRQASLKPAFYLPLYKTDYIQQRILTENNYYESENLNYICNVWNNGQVSNEIATKTILDIGANIGNHTLFFFYECGIDKAYCFEPMMSTFEILQKNIEINNLGNKTQLINHAVGKSACKASITHYDKRNIGSTQIAIDATGTIPVVSIDSMNIQDDVKLIKIDVEGFEVNVIEGCLETIEKYKPYILIEIQNENFNAINTLLSQLDYHYEKLNIVNYFYYCI